jgi:hypothetical protein
VAAAQRQAQEVEIWPEHAEAVQLFKACDTQWTVHLGLGGLYYQGLDFQKAASIARDWLDIKPTRTLLAQLAILQDEAKQILNNQ